MADSSTPPPAAPTQPVPSSSSALGQDASLADSTVVTTLSTALPGEPVSVSSLGKKEAPLLRSSENTVAQTEVSASTSAEHEPTREKEMNLERLEAQIQEAKVRGPKKVAVAADTLPVEEPKTVAQPVVILPLSEQNMAEARKKNPTYSIKWLWAWCRRQMRKFAEILVMYREPPQA